jgi:hypothetical protein
MGLILEGSNDGENGKQKSRSINGERPRFCYQQDATRPFCVCHAEIMFIPGIYFDKYSIALGEKCRLKNPLLKFYFLLQSAPGAKRRELLHLEQTVDSKTEITAMYQQT